MDADNMWRHRGRYRFDQAVSDDCYLPGQVDYNLPTRPPRHFHQSSFPTQTNLDQDPTTAGYTRHQLRDRGVPYSYSNDFQQDISGSYLYGSSNDNCNNNTTKRFGDLFSVPDTSKVDSGSQSNQRPYKVVTTKELYQQFKSKHTDRRGKKRQIRREFRQRIKEFRSAHNPENNERRILCRTRMKDIILALVTRAMFIAHGLIAIWRAYKEWETITMWLLLVPVGVLILEALFTIGARGGEEYKWISPCVVLYLASVVPAIWFLELKNFDARAERHICNDFHWAKQAGCKIDFQKVYADIGGVLGNATLRQIACDEQKLYQLLKANRTAAAALETTTVAEVSEIATTQIGGAIDDVLDKINAGNEALDKLFSQIDIFDETTWVLVMHQLLLFILIIGRWLLPTGEGISRDQLSQLLLVFIGVGADILEFVTETIKEKSVRCDKALIIVIMSFWSWSTLQFTLVLTASKARRTRAVGIYDGEDGTDSPVVVVEEDERPGRFRKFCGNMEVWGIMSTLILQDGPFLATRIYIMVGRNVVHQMIVFFTCKNALVFILQFYRLFIIAFQAPKGEDEEEDDLDVTAFGALGNAMLGKVLPNTGNGAIEEVKTEDGSSGKSLKVGSVVEEREMTEKQGNNVSNNNSTHAIAFVNVPSVVWEQKPRK